MLDDLGTGERKLPDELCDAEESVALGLDPDHGTATIHAEAARVGVQRLTKHDAIDPRQRLG